MFAVLELEFIAENFYASKRHASERDARYGEYLGRDKSRPWVARLIGFDERLSFTREFVRGQIDYSRANSVGSRGVYLYFPLKDGIYEVNARETWKRTRRYFLRVEDAKMDEISREEVVQCLLQREA